MSNELIDLQVEIIRKSDKALMIRYGRRTECWIPKSQIKNELQASRNELMSACIIKIPHWLAKKNGLIF